MNEKQAECETCGEMYVGDRATHGYLRDVETGTPESPEVKTVCVTCLKAGERRRLGHRLQPYTEAS